MSNFESTEDASIEPKIESNCIICSNDPETSGPNNFNMELLRILYDLLKFPDSSNTLAGFRTEVHEAVNFCANCRLTLFKFRNVKDELRALEAELIKIHSYISQTLSGASFSLHDTHDIEQKCGLVLEERLQNRIGQRFESGTIESRDNEIPLHIDRLDVNYHHDGGADSYGYDVLVEEDPEGYSNGGLISLQPCTVSLMRFEDEWKCKIPLLKTKSPLVFNTRNRTFHIRRFYDHSNVSAPRKMIIPTKVKAPVKVAKKPREILPIKFKLKCSQCKKEYDDLNDLTNHIVREGCKLPNVLKNRSKTNLFQLNRKYTLEERRNILKRKQAAKIASASKKPSKPKWLTFKCQHCEKQLKTKRSLNYHIEVTHLKAPRSPKPKKPPETSFLCEFCGKVFSKAFCRMTHQLSKHYEEYLAKNGEDAKFMERRKNMHCSVCDKTFSSKDARDEHHAVKHLQEFKYYCEECGRGFVNRSSMIRHQSSSAHKLERRFPCDHCHLRFNLPQTLKYHLQKVHLVGGKAKDTVCTFCSKLFWDRSELNRHIKKTHREHNTQKSKRHHKVEILDFSAPEKMYITGHKNEDIAPMWIPPPVNMPHPNPHDGGLTSWLLPRML